MRQISVNEFKLRLGVNALAIANSTNPMCIEFNELLNKRKTVFLTSTKLYNYLILLVNNNLPEADPNFPGSGPITANLVDQILEKIDGEQPLPAYMDTFE